MTKPIPDKAEVALEYPDKLYIGTFERTARFDAHLDDAGISLSLHRLGGEDTRKSVRMHFHYALFAEILQDLAKTVAVDAAVRCGAPRHAAGCGQGALPRTRPRSQRQGRPRRHDARRRGPAAACHGVVADKSTASGSPPLRQGGETVHLRLRM